MHVALLRRVAAVNVRFGGRGSSEIFKRHTEKEMNNIHSRLEALPRSWRLCVTFVVLSPITCALHFTRAGTVSSSLQNLLARHYV